ncbi:hypothetical protein C7401_13631 [Paraburkholderia unamae]|uniref:hypothetical protein n=1 Tax=Paraburkholderia unamae TaxID=219649 RepID=UPI000DC6032D|nr:hypothetical protein [Paraburkholderia unamae]RAR51671.1 hypothetical protein C7401_13631 [Paraburkholderia unamae]
MSEIKIDTSRTNTTTHRAVVSSEAINRLMFEEICKQLGLDPGAENIGFSTRINNRTMSYGTEIEAIVSVTVHHDAEPQASEQ